MVVNPNENDLKSDCSLIKSIQIRVAGEIIEDITDYHILETLLNDFTFKKNYYRTNDPKDAHFHQEGTLIKSKSSAKSNANSVVSKLEDKSLCIENGKLNYKYNPYVYFKIPINSLFLGKNHTRETNGPYISNHKSPLFPAFLLKEKLQKVQIFVELNQFAFFVPITNISLASFGSPADRYDHLQRQHKYPNTELAKIITKDVAFIIGGNLDQEGGGEKEEYIELPLNYDAIYNEFINSSVTYNQCLEDFYEIGNAERRANYMPMFTFKEFCLKSPIAQLIIANKDEKLNLCVLSRGKDRSLVKVYNPLNLNYYMVNKDDKIERLTKRQWSFEGVFLTSVSHLFFYLPPTKESYALIMTKALHSFEEVGNLNTSKDELIDSLIKNDKAGFMDSVISSLTRNIVLLDQQIENLHDIYDTLKEGLTWISNETKLESILEESAKKNISSHDLFNAINSKPETPIFLAYDDLDWSSKKVLKMPALKRIVDYNVYLIFRQIRFRDPAIKKQYMDNGLKIQGRILEIYNKTTSFKLEKQYTFDIYDTSVKSFYFFFLNGEYHNNPTMRLSNRYSLCLDNLKIKVNNILYPQEKIIPSCSDSDYNGEYLKMLSACFKLEDSNINNLSYAVNLNTCDILTQKAKGIDYPFINDTPNLFKDFDFETEMIGKCIFGVSFEALYELVGKKMEKKTIEITFERGINDHDENKMPMEYEMYVVFEREKSILLTQGGKTNYISK